MTLNLSYTASGSLRQSRSVHCSSTLASTNIIWNGCWASSIKLFKIRVLHLNRVYPTPLLQNHIYKTKTWFLPLNPNFPLSVVLISNYPYPNFQKIVVWEMYPNCATTSSILLNSTFVFIAIDCYRCQTIVHYFALWIRCILRHCHQSIPRWRRFETTITSSLKIYRNTLQGFSFLAVCFPPCCLTFYHSPRLTTHLKGALWISQKLVEGLASPLWGRTQLSVSRNNSFLTCSS